MLNNRELLVEELRITKEHLYRLLTSETASIYIWYKEAVRDMEKRIKKLERQIKLL